MNSIALISVGALYAVPAAEGAAGAAGACVAVVCSWGSAALAILAGRPAERVTAAAVADKKSRRLRSIASPPVGIRAHEQRRPSPISRMISREEIYEVRAKGARRGRNG